MRTYAGRAKSNINRDTGVPQQLLPMNLAGPIQLVLQDPEDGDHMMGLLPAYMIITDIIVISPADAGTYDLTLPAYGDMVGIAAVAAGDATAVGNKATIDVGAYTPFGEDRPLIITTTGVTGLFRLGIFGFPLDNAQEQEN
jgi:hypothetical protein